MDTLRAPRRPVLVPLGVAAVAVVILLLPLPGTSLSVRATRAVAGAAAGMHGVGLISEAALAVLAAATLVALFLVVRQPSSRRGPALAASVGVAVAYFVSEIVKGVFEERRPCQVWRLPGECPAEGDWSFPSNHSTLAFAAVVVLVVATRALWVAWVSVALASIVAVGRIMQGAHYLHDVSAGALIGLSIPALAAIVVVLIGRWRVQRRPSTA